MRPAVVTCLTRGVCVGDRVALSWLATGCGRKP
jgi:hypothetical protein